MLLAVKLPYVIHEYVCNTAGSESAVLFGKASGGLPQLNERSMP